MLPLDHRTAHHQAPEAGRGHQVDQRLAGRGHTGPIEVVAELATGLRPFGSQCGHDDLHAVLDRRLPHPQLAQASVVGTTTRGAPRADGATSSPPTGPGGGCPAGATSPRATVPVGQRPVHVGGAPARLVGCGRPGGSRGLSWAWTPSRWPTTDSADPARVPASRWAVRRARRRVSSDSMDEGPGRSALARCGILSPCHLLLAPPEPPVVRSTAEYAPANGRRPTCPTSRPARPPPRSPARR